MKTRGFLRPMLKSLESRRRAGVHYRIPNDESPIVRSRRSRNKHQRKERRDGGGSSEIEGKHFVIRILMFAWGFL